MDSAAPMTSSTTPFAAAFLDSQHADTLAMATGLSATQLIQVFGAYAPREGLEAALVEQILILGAAMREACRHLRAPDLTANLAVRFCSIVAGLQRETRAAAAMLIRRQGQSLPEPQGEPLGEISRPERVLFKAPSEPRDDQFPAAGQDVPHPAAAACDGMGTPDESTGHSAAAGGRMVDAPALQGHGVPDETASHVKPPRPQSADMDPETRERPRSGVLPFMASMIMQDCRTGVARSSSRSRLLSHAADLDTIVNGGHRPDRRTPVPAERLMTHARVLHDATGAMSLALPALASG